MQGFLIKFHQLCFAILTDTKYKIAVDFSLMFCTKAMMPQVVKIFKSANYSVADTIKLPKNEIEQLFKNWKQGNLMQAMLDTDDVDYNMDEKVDNTNNPNDDNDNDEDEDDDDDDVEDDDDDEDEDESMGVNSNDNNNDADDCENLDSQVQPYNPHDHYYTKKETQEQMINCLQLLLKKTTEIKEKMEASQPNLL